MPIIVNDFSQRPDEIEGCPVCYLSRNDSLFEKQEHIFMESGDSIAFMKINNELNKFKREKTTHGAFEFVSRNIIEQYSNEKYLIILKAHFEDSTSYESWKFNGVMIIKNRTGEQTEIEYVAVCGC